MADHCQGYPGHCNPPASLLAYAGLFMVAASMCAVVGLFAIRRVMFTIAVALMVGAAMSLGGIPESRRVCERSGGGICPSCGQKNEVKWYS